MDGKWEQLVADLRRELEELRGENARLRGELEAAYRRIAELERAAARQAAPFRRREQRRVPPEQRKRPGRKPGHRGTCRMVPTKVDHELAVPLDACPRCGGPVTDKSSLVQYIEEIPPLRPEVTRLTIWSGTCRCCGEVFSTHPLQTSRAQGAAAVQLGPRALALGAMLNKQLGITMRGTCRVLREVCGLRITPGGLAQGLARVAGKLASEYEALLKGLRQSPAVFADETSWWVGGPGWWLWGFTTPEAKDSPYLREWELFFRTVMLLYGMRPQWDETFFAARRAAMEQWCDRLLGQPCSQPGEAKIRNRLAKQRPHRLGCLYQPAAEPTNNRAERELRPAVIARKLSCGNKTPAGRDCWEVLASIARTCSLRAEDFVEFLATRLPLSPQAR